MNSILKKSLDYLEYFIMIICQILMFSLLMLASYQVFSRYVLHHSPAWISEILIYGFVWLILIGSAILVRQKSHAAVEIIIDITPEKLYRFINIVVIIISIGFLIILYFQGLKVMENVEGVKATASGIPKASIYLPIPVSSILMIVFFIENLIKQFSRKYRESEEEK